MNSRSGRLGVGIIGAGRVGPVLGAALANAGHAVIGVNAISAASRDRVAALLPGVPHLSVEQVVERSELVVLAVPSAELPGLVSGLATLNVWMPGQLVLHTAPEFGVGVLEPAQRLGVIPLAVHPVLTFTGTSLDLARLRESCCVVTAAPPVLPIAQALAVEMGAEPVVLAEDARAAYADSVSAATELVHSVAQNAALTLAALGVPQPAAVLSGALSAALDLGLRSGGADDAAPQGSLE